MLHGGWITSFKGPEPTLRPCFILSGVNCDIRTAAFSPQKNRELVIERIDIKALLLEQFGDRVIAYSPVLARISGSVVAGVMLSQALYWTKRTSEDGWFYKSIEEWRDELSMGRCEQERARRVLRECGFLDEQRRGVPARLFFRLDLKTIADALHGITRDLTVAQIIQIHRTALLNLSKLGMARAKKAAVQHEFVDYVKVLERDGGTCHICGKLVTKGPGQFGKCLQFDHVNPIANGGHHVESNIKVSHADCNHNKGAELDYTVCTTGTNWNAPVEQPSMLPQSTQECTVRAIIYKEAENTTEITSETTTQNGEWTAYQERQKLEAERLAEKQSRRGKKAPFQRSQTSSPKVVTYESAPERRAREAREQVARVVASLPPHR